MSHIDRRRFLQQSVLATAGATLPLTVVELAFAKPAENFTLAYISDAHLQHVEGTRFVRSRDRSLSRAITEINSLNPKPDFVIFGGDLAHLGTQAELDHGAELLAKLRSKFYTVMGEHDYYLDLGTYWSKLFGPQYRSFDHKGVHFVVLNSILTYDDWTFDRWPTPERRMLEMAAMEAANGSPFMVGERQRRWLAQDLAKVATTTPIVVFSHAPLQKIRKDWNFWTEDAEDVHALLAPFERVSVLYGHVHQIQRNQIGNISFNSMMPTAWPWTYPHSYYSNCAISVPKLTVSMDRTASFSDSDVTGWQTIDVHSGRVSIHDRPYSEIKQGVALDRPAAHPRQV